MTRFVLLGLELVDAVEVLLDDLVRLSSRLARCRLIQSTVDRRSARGRDVSFGDVVGAFGVDLLPALPVEQLPRTSATALISRASIVA